MADHTYQRIGWYKDGASTVAEDGAKIVPNLGTRRFLIDSHDGINYGAEEIVEVRARKGHTGAGFATNLEIIDWFLENHKNRGYQCYKITEILNGHTYRDLQGMDDETRKANRDVIYYDESKEPLTSFNLELN